MQLSKRFFVYNQQTSNRYNQRLFSNYHASFGIIADIQYVNEDDSMNFQNTKLRRYRNSLEIFKEACSYWNKINVNITNTFVLGDMLDGKCNITKTQYACLTDMQNIYLKFQKKNRFHFCFGNHCHYNFDRKELNHYFIESNSYVENPIEVNKRFNDAPLHYDFSLHPKWRIAFVDSYDVSLIGASSEKNNLNAKEILKINNPNDIETSGTWFNNLPLSKYRFVPYNGAVSETQLQWLENVLIDANSKNQNVIICSHQPVLSPLKPQSLIWNSETIMSILRRHGNVKLWLAGHDHDGNYCIDDSGCHHLIPPAPIECDKNQHAFGHINCFDDHLELCWQGKVPNDNQSPLPWPRILKIK